MTSGEGMGAAKAEGGTEELILYQFNARPETKTALPVRGVPARTRLI